MINDLLAAIVPQKTKSERTLKRLMEIGDLDRTGQETSYSNVVLSKLHGLLV